MPGNDDGGGEKSFVGAKIPTTHKSALQKAAYSKSTPSKRVSASELVREAITEWFQNHADELPEEALDDLDENLVADGGRGGL